MRPPRQLVMLIIAVLIATLIGSGGFLGLREMRHLHSDHLIASRLREDGAEITFEDHPLPLFSQRITAVSLEGKVLTAGQLRSIRRLRYLVSLNLNDSVLSDKCIGELQEFDRLRFLYLSRTNIDDDNFMSLAVLTQLVKVHVTGSNVTRRGAQAFMNKSRVFVLP